MSDKRVANIFPILLINFIGALGYSIVFPFLVFLVTKFGGNALIFGLMGAVYPAFQLIGAPMLGKWSDIYGRKRILLVSQAGTLFGWLIFILAFFLPLTILFQFELSFTGLVVFTLPLIILFAARAIDGLTGGNISVANAYMSDVTADKDRNRNFGRLNLSQNVGFIMGPAIAGLLGGTHLQELLPVIAASVISVAGISATYFYLPESEAKEFSESPVSAGVKKILNYEGRECYGEDIKASAKGASFSDILKLDNIAYFLLLNFLIFLGFNFFYTAFPIHVTQKLGWTITEMGLFFSVLSIVMVIVQGPVLSFASKKYSEKVLILVGCFVLGTGFVLMISLNVILLYLSAVLFALGNGLMWPSFLSLLSKTAGKKNQGAVQGYASSAGSLAGIAGLITGGILYESAGAITFLISAAIIYLVLFLSLKLK